MSWWADAVGYEVYLRSFADSDGDGVGDFPGLTKRLDHLADLGIDAVWVTPFYPSPQRDFGYDVADYCDVDPAFGTLEQFDEFAARAHELGLKVVIDIVPNHSSSEHPWFRSALEGKDSPHRDHYVWRDPAPDGGPPNNWLAIFGGPAWTLDEASGQYYMHLFLPEQPDLNWASPAVHRAFEQVLEFWMARGVDGFRIDVAHSLCEDRSFADNPPKPGIGREPEDFGDLLHVHDIDQPETIEVYRSWRRLVADRDVLLIGEVYVDPAPAMDKYVDDALHLTFFFGLNPLEWDPVTFASTLREATESLPDGWGWIQGSHDEHRAVTRFGGGPEGVERSLALWAALFGLPGMPFLFQGEELGLENGVVAPEHVLDPVGKRIPEDGRDPCRTPMPWEPGAGHGFSSGEPWLISETRTDNETASVQAGDPESPLSRTRALLDARRSTAGRRGGPVDWLDAPEGVVAYRRGEVAHVANLTDGVVTVALPGPWDVAHATGEAVLVGDRLELGARTGAILGVVA